jgi:membrane-associated phospholipid phosphatase
MFIFQKQTQFFSTLFHNLIGCFRGRTLLWHLLAIGLTVVLVTSGLDWQYFIATRAPIFRTLSWPGIRIGTRLPIALPIVLFGFGLMLKGDRLNRLAAAVAQSVVLGSLISSAYKAFTGRAHPAHQIGVDISHDFRFGFLRGGVFWGWPSSHTTIAFAMAVTIYVLLPKQRWAGILAIAYALYVGLGTSVTIHWLSDFVAGAIVGTLIGAVVGKSFTGSMIEQTETKETDG